MKTSQVKIETVVSPKSVKQLAICSRNQTSLFCFHCAWCLIWKGQPVAVVSPGSDNRLNLGKKPFSRGRRWIGGSGKPAQKGPLADSRFHGISLNTFKQRPPILISDHDLNIYCFYLLCSSCVSPQVIWMSCRLVTFYSFLQAFWTL